MSLVDEAGTRAGKYTVDVGGGQGVQIGDCNLQSNIFNRPAGWMMPADASGSTGSARGPRVEIRDSQGVQVGDHATQLNIFIGQYIGQQTVIHTPAKAAAWPVRVGDVPPRSPAFQARVSLLTALGKPGAGVPVVRAVTGMWGVGKTQVAAAYARLRMAEGWRLVAWVNASDMATALNEIGER